MAKLPVYNTTANISVSNGVNVPQNNQMFQAINNLAQQGQELALKWQETQNESEWLDGKNKMLEETDKIFSEAEAYNDYKTPKDIETKQKELEQRLGGVMNNVASGFTNQINANNFSKHYQLSTFENKEKLKEIFRKKYIDNNNANLLKSEDMNKNAFIQSGSQSYKDSFFADLERSFNAGYISEEQMTLLKLKTVDWDELAMVNQISKDPDGYLEKLKNGELKDYKQVDALNKALKKQQEINKIQQKISEHAVTRDVLSKLDENDLAGSIKLLDDNKDLMDKDIYKKARKNLLEVNGITAETRADTASDLLLRISSLPSNVEKVEEFYSQSNKILNEIEDKYGNYELSLADKKRLTNLIYQKQGGNIDVLKSNDKGGFMLGFSFEEANEYIEDNYTASGDKNKLLLEYFRTIDGKDYSGREKKSILKEMINKRMNENFNKVISIPKKGDVVNGYRFKGGNVNDKNNWELVK